VICDLQTLAYGQDAPLHNFFDVRFHVLWRCIKQEFHLLVSSSRNCSYYTNRLEEHHKATKQTKHHGRVKQIEAKIEQAWDVMIACNLHSTCYAQNNHCTIA